MNSIASMPCIERSNLTVVEDPIEKKSSARYLIMAILVLLEALQKLYHILIYMGKRRANGAAV